MLATFTPSRTKGCGANQYQLGESDSTEVHLCFRDLDTMAKALEQSGFLGNPGGLELHGKVHDMLRFIQHRVLEAVPPEPR